MTANFREGQGSMPGEKEIRRHAKPRRGEEGGEGGFERGHKKGGGGKDRGKKGGKKGAVARPHHSDSGGLTSAEIDAMNAKGEIPRGSNLPEDFELPQEPQRPEVLSSGLTEADVGKIFYIDGAYHMLMKNPAENTTFLTPVKSEKIKKATPEQLAQIPVLITVDQEAERKREQEKSARVDLQRMLFTLGETIETDNIDQLRQLRDAAVGKLKEQMESVGAGSVNGNLDFATTRVVIEHLQKEGSTSDANWSREDIDGMIETVGGLKEKIALIEAQEEKFATVLEAGVPVQYAKEVMGWQGVDARKVVEALGWGIQFEDVERNKKNINTLIKDAQRRGRRQERKENGIAPTPPPQRKSRDMRDLARPVEPQEYTERDYESKNRKFIVDCGFLTAEELEKDKTLTGDKLRNIVFIVKRAQKVLMPDELFSIFINTPDVEQRAEAIKNAANEKDPHRSVDETRKTESMVEGKLKEFGDKIGLRKLYQVNYTTAAETRGITSMVYQRCAQVMAAARENFSQAEIDECLASEKGLMASLVEKHDNLFNDLRRLGRMLDVFEPGKTLTEMKDRLLTAIVAGSSLKEDQARSYLEKNDLEPIFISIRDKNMKPETPKEKQERIEQMVSYLEELKESLPQILHIFSAAKSRREIDGVYFGDKYTKSQRDFLMIGREEMETVNKEKLYDEVEEMFDQIQKAYEERKALVSSEPEVVPIVRADEKRKTVTEEELLARIAALRGEVKQLDLQARQDINVSFGTEDTIKVFLKSARDLKGRYQKECEASAADLSRENKLSAGAKAQADELLEKIRDLIDFCVSAQENVRRAVSPSAPIVPRGDVPRPAPRPEAENRDSRFRDVLQSVDRTQNRVRDMLKDQSVSDQDVKKEYQLLMGYQDAILEGLTDQVLDQSNVAKSLKSSIDAFRIEMSSNARLQGILSASEEPEAGVGSQPEQQAGRTEQEAREFITEGDIREMLVEIYQGMGFSEKLANAMADEKNSQHVEIATKKLVEALIK